MRYRPYKALRISSSTDVDMRKRRRDVASAATVQVLRSDARGLLSQVSQARSDKGDIPDRWRNRLIRTASLFAVYLTLASAGWVPSVAGPFQSRSPVPSGTFRVCDLVGV